MTSRSRIRRRPSPPSPSPCSTPSMRSTPRREGRLRLSLVSAPLRLPLSACPSPLAPLRLPLSACPSPLAHLRLPLSACPLSVCPAPHRTVSANARRTGSARPSSDAHVLLDAPRPALRAWHDARAPPLPAPRAADVKAPASSRCKRR
eukprot:7388595-Prymnesium_polylepis.1